MKMTIDIANLLLRTGILIPLIWFLIFQHNNRKLNGKFYLIRRFTISVGIAFILYVAGFLFVRLVNFIWGVEILANWLQITLIITHVISIAYLVDAGETLRKIRNHEQGK